MIVPESRVLAEALVELASETPTADARSLIQHPGQERGRLGSRDREAGGRRGPSSNVVFPELCRFLDAGKNEALGTLS